MSHAILYQYFFLLFYTHAHHHIINHQHDITVTSTNPETCRQPSLPTVFRFFLLTVAERSPRAGATDFGLEGQLVQKRGPWRKGAFCKLAFFYTI